MKISLDEIVMAMSTQIMNGREIEKIVRTMVEKEKDRQLRIAEMRIEDRTNRAVAKALSIL